MSKTKDKLIEQMDGEHPLNRHIADAEQFSHYPDQNELIAMAYCLIDRLTNIIQEVADDHGLDYYYQSDEILYADRWMCLVNNEIDSQNLDSDIKNLRLFTRHV